MSGEGVLVTGGAGFIGSNLVDMLLEKGHAVYVLDNLSTGRLENISEHLESSRLRFIRGDIRDPLENHLNPRTLGEGPLIEAIFHLAARVDVTSSFQAPLEDAKVNYLGTMNVLDYALRNGIKKVVFSSSAAVYGDAIDLPVSEASVASPLSPYGLHKYSSEQLLSIYNDQYGMRNTSLRFFNVYGPRQDPSSPYSGVITKFLERATRGEPLTVFGDGDQTRDFIYVRDVATSIYAAYVRSARGTLNIATGTETSVNRLAQLILSVTGSGSQVVHSPARKGEILRSFADVSAASEMIGFESEHDLRSGLVETYRWFKGRR
jgi:UDP-glucose 4-epimerase